MQYQGVLKKMPTEFAAPIQYYLMMEGNIVHMNQVLNKRIGLSFVGYQCLQCGLDKEIFRQGFCKSCFFETPSAGDWIMRPELSKAHLGQEDRDLAYEKQVQLQPHIVYLAYSSNTKVGVTRKSQVPTRWIDQGATQALEVVEVPNRYLAGITEVALKEHIADKTHWKKMLENNDEADDLVSIKNDLIPFVPDEVKEYILSSQPKPTQLEFPMLQIPQKVKSLNLIKAQQYSGVLKGIKGQYLIFEDNTVFNIRSNEGQVVQLTIH